MSSATERLLADSLQELLYTYHPGCTMVEGKLEEIIVRAHAALEKFFEAQEKLYE